MQFALNEDQIAVRDMAREFSAEKIAPHALRWDEEKHFPVDVMREAASLGIGGIYIKDDVGGSAMTRFDAALIFEALATGCPTVSAFISIHNMASWMIDAYGNDAQRQKPRRPSWARGRGKTSDLPSSSKSRPGTWRMPPT